MIGTQINTLLAANESLTALVDEDNVFPYVANADTPLPLIVYTIDDLKPEYVKDGWCYDDIIFSVTALDDDYDNLLSIATEIREALEWQSFTGSNKIIMTGFIEGFSVDSNVFLNKQTFSVRINEYE